MRELRLAFPTIEMLFDYNGDRYNTIVVHEYRDGLVAHETA